MNSNRDLYQIIKIDKKVSQELVIQKCKALVKKDVADEVGIAALVLSDPLKRTEYDRGVWKESWREEWEEQNAFRHSIFQAIMNHKESLINRGEKTPDGIKIYVFIHEDLDPSLWAPCKGIVGWIDKIWDIFDSCGDNKNWKKELEDYKNRMINALNQAYEKNKKNPFNTYWEKVEGGNCAICGKIARLGKKGVKYCSPECYDVKYEFPPKREDYKCEECRKKDEKVRKMEDGQYYHQSCFDKKSEKNGKDTGYCVYCKKKNGRETWNWGNTISGKYERYCSYECREKAGTDYCDNCQKQIEKYREGHKEVSRGIHTMDSKGQWRTFCSEDCRKKWQQKPGNELGITKLNKLGEFLTNKRGGKGKTEYEYNRLTGKTTKKKVAWKPLQELLNWMKKEGIINISLNSQGNLVIEYSSRSENLNDSQLTSEQKEIKEFFQQAGQKSLNQNEIEQAIKQLKQNQEEDKNKNGWVLPTVIIGGIGVIICILIGVVIHYRNKQKRGY